nr:anthrone oxygenase family protein [Nocardiopsis baichengensis]
MFVLTVAVNVPLNDALDAAGPVHGDQAAQVRAAFERPWVRWNAVRTALSAAGAVCLAFALVSAA